jgi:uncharacterized protein DUF4845
MLDESVASSRGQAARRAAGWPVPCAARQRGLSLVSLIFVGVIVVILLTIGMKVVPALAEYLAVERAVQKVASEGSTVREIRNAFDKYATIDDIKSISGKDLDITKDAERIVVSYSYSYSVPVLDNVRIVIDFSGSNRDHPGRAAQP